MILVDLSAERAVLSGLVKYGRDVFIDLEGMLSVRDFSEDINQSIFKVISDIFESNIDAKLDIPTIKSKAADIGLLKEINEDKYLSQLFNFHVEQENVVEFAKKLKRLAIGRQIYHEVAEDIKHDVSKITGSEPLSEIIAIPENRVYEFSNSLSANNEDQIIHVASGSEEYLDNVENNPVTIIGIPTPWPEYNSVVSGLRRKTVNLFAARSGVGKSLLADNILGYVAVTLKIPVLYLDTEMDADQHLARLLSMMSGVPISDIETGAYGKNMALKSKVRRAQKALSKSPYMFKSVGGLGFDEILSFARRWVVKTVGQSGGVTRDCLLCYDYFKLMNSESFSKNMAEHQILGLQATQLHDFVRKWDIASIAFVQLNREFEVAASDRLQNLCSSLATYYRLTPEEVAKLGGPSAGNRKMCFQKARFGLDQTNQRNFIQFDQHILTGRITEVKQSYTTDFEMTDV